MNDDVLTNNSNAMPRPTPTPPPMSTQTFDSDSNYNPYPTPAPGPAPKRERFIIMNKSKGKQTIYDSENDFTIKYSDDNGYVAYKDDKEVYHIYPGGATSFKKPDGNYVITWDKMTIDDIGSNTVVFDNDCYYGFNGETIEELSDFNKYPRFYTRTKQDGSEVLYDLKNNLRIVDDEFGGYTVYNEYDDVIYAVDCDGVGLIRTKTGENIYPKPPFTKEQYDSNMVVETSDGFTYVISDRRILEKTDEDGIVSKYTYDDDSNYYVEKSTGEAYYYKDGRERRHVYVDGVISMTTSDYDFYILYPDGFWTQDNAYGTYTIGDDNSITCITENGETYVYDKYGTKTKYISEKGIEYDYNYDKRSVKSTNNGRVSYSRINHIEYDEEAYNAILKALNDVESSYHEPIKSAQFMIEGAIDSFPDKYTENRISDAISNIEVHINLINTLSEVTNYSLLAYQTCDENLKTKLEKLVDSLFGDADKTMGDKFKKAIDYTITTRDGIKGYKEETNFWKSEFIVDLLVNYPNSSVLEGEELTKYMEENNIRDLETLVIAKEIVNINGVNMPIYKVVDTKDLDIDGYNKYVDDSNKAIGNVDKRVLQYEADTGAHVSYFSSYTVDDGLYNKDGSMKDPYYAGYANASNLNTVAVYRPQNPDDVDCVLHELGHTFDHCICHNTPGEWWTTTSPDFDYSIFPDGISTRELAHKEYGGYNPNYEYDPDYSNDGAYQPTEFFAESFRNYYSSDPEKRAEFADLIPETYEYFDKMEEWAGEQNGNK